MIVKRNVGAIMRHVLYASLPGTAMLLLTFGAGQAQLLALSVLGALGCEALALKLRGRVAAEGLRDGSALLTGLLLGLALPATAPWWCAVLGSAFAILVGKQLFGGLGFNPFNPAMLGYAFLLLAFTPQLAVWVMPASVDAWSGASPLGHLQSALKQQLTVSEALRAPVFFGLTAPGWTWINLSFLLGGIYLCVRRLADWRIPAGMLAALVLISTVFSLADGDRYAGPLFHLFHGATMLGAFFIATDPVTASTTPRGRWLFGAGVGVLLWLIRSVGIYPDGLAFAVLLMNLVAPTLDTLTVPLAYGRCKP